MLFSQDVNPLTGDIGFNPASYGLSLRDLDSVAAIKQKALVSSGLISLTQEEYRQVETVLLTKYAGLEGSSGIFSGAVLPAVSMTGKDPGLYLTQGYLGFWDGDSWQSYIGNDGKFLFMGDIDNFIQWDGNALTIRGTLQLPGGDSIDTVLENAILKTELPGTYDSGINKFRQWLQTGDLAPYTVPGNYTGIYLDSTGLYGKKNGISQFSISSSTGDAMFRGIIYANGGEFDGNITSTATITGGSFRTYNATTQRYSEVQPGKIALQNNSGVDIVSIDGSNFRYINADAFIAANTHHAFQTTAEILSGFGSTIGFDFGSYNDNTKVFGSYGSKLLFNYNSPSSVDSLTQNEIRNFTAPNYSATGPIIFYKGYAHFSYMINASFVGRMKIPVGTNLY